MAASNSKDCFHECIGKRVRGVLFDAFPRGQLDLRGTKALIFDDGTALVISATGTFWIEGAPETKSAIQAKWIELERTKREIEEVLIIAGALKEETK